MENRIGDVIANMLDSGTVGRVFELRSGQTKGYEIGTCYIPIKCATLRNQRKYYLGRNQDNVYECGDMSICRLLYQQVRTITVQLRVLIQYKANIIITIIECNLFSA
jgi:hypothetical protein